MVENHRLPNGLLFGLPVVFDTSREDIKPGQVREGKGKDGVLCLYMYACLPVYGCLHMVSNAWLRAACLLLLQIVVDGQVRASIQLT